MPGVFIQKYFASQSSLVKISSDFSSSHISHIQSSLAETSSHCTNITLSKMPNTMPDALCGSAQWSTPANLALFDAASRGDLEATLNALSLGASASYCCSLEEGSPSAVHSVSKAVDGDAAACASELINQGALVDATLISNRNTPLHLAVASGKLSLCKVLLANGADPSAPNSYGNTSLHVAVQSSSVEITKLLIDHGAVASAKNNRGSTALHFVACLATATARTGNDSDAMLTIAKILKADANAVDIHGHSPLHIAAQRGCDALVVLLVCSYNADLTLQSGIDAKGRGGRTARQQAIFGDQMGTAALIERMEILADAFSCNTVGNTRPMRKILEFEAALPSPVGPY